MRDLLISLMCLSFSMAAYSQDWEQVKADDSCIWGEGYGPSVDEADRQALSVLVSRIAVSVVNDYRQVEEQVSSSKGNEYYSRMSNRSSAYSITGRMCFCVPCRARLNCARKMGRCC